jgi:hypothetical protein
MNSTQVADYSNFQKENIVFSKPESGSIAGSIPKISFKRIRMAARNRDGSVGELVLLTPPNLMSFGLQENIEMGTGNVNGYQFPMCLWNKNGPSVDENKFVDKFNEIVDYCKKYLVDNRDLIEKYDLEMNDLKKFNPLYWKMDKGKIVEDKGPMLYIKVINNRASEKISTYFIDDETNTFIDPMDLRNKRCYVQAAIKIESIFIGNKISLQIKLKEAIVRVIDTGSIRSLLRPNALVSPPTATLSSSTANADLSPSYQGEEEETLSVDENYESSAVAPPTLNSSSLGEEEEDEEDEEEEDEEEEDEEEEPTKESEVQSSTKPVAKMYPVNPVVSTTPTPVSSPATTIKDKLMSATPTEEKKRGRKAKV